MLVRSRRRRRPGRRPCAGGWRLAIITTVLVWCAAPAFAADSVIYCEGSLDGGATGALTDAEHAAPRLGDPPLPAGVSERRLDVGGVATRLLESGPSAADEAVVFVHGNPGSARDFDVLMASTGRYARAIAFDVPGLGHADDRRGIDYSTAGAAAYIGRVIAQLGVRRVHLVLHDLGGIWGLQWAVGSLGAVQSVSLIDTGVLIGYFGHPLGLSWTVPILGEGEMATITRDQFKTAISLQDPLPERYLDRMYDDFDRATRCATLDYYRSVGLPDELGRRQAAVLRGADLPSLVVWGARDSFVPVAVAAHQTEAFPHARIEILAASGHWPQLDDAPRVDALVTGFLRDRVRSPRLVLSHPRVRAGRYTLSVWVSVDGAPHAPGVRLSVLRAGRVVGSASRARTIARAPQRVALRLRQPLRRGARYTLRADSAELGSVTRRVRVPR
jgi:pimeloyl-ACP methyl ester carboxylesterase